MKKLFHYLVSAFLLFAVTLPSVQASTDVSMVPTVSTVSYDDSSGNDGMPGDGTAVNRNNVIESDADPATVYRKPCAFKPTNNTVMPILFTAYFGRSPYVGVAAA